MNDEPHLPRLAQLCDNIGAVIAGRHAQNLLDSDDISDDEPGVIVVLPSWVWVLPGIDVGRKGLVNGVRQPMPSRLGYDQGPVRVLNADETITWELAGLGNSDTGDGVVSYTPLRKQVTVTLSETIVVTAEVHPVTGRKHRERVLRSIAKAGLTARWELMSGFEFFTKQRLAAANNIVAAEIAQHKGIPLAGVVDDITLEELGSQMLFGQGGTSVIQRMIDVALELHKFDRVDPMHYFTVGIRARAEEAVRRQIGDPKVGPKVRRVFARTQASTLDELIDEYKRLYPKDSLAKKRALAALTAGPDIATTQRQFRDEITSGPGDGAEL
ncbi:hypothetical protein [Curtobacterium sp. MCSS17_016]|uniref:hypothetical protein n=1 Tax=Curtobacterium sp. MCSS17_016 TaxID=2175644 RepID=UPI000DAAD51D|nr:hypothetical protein [Curtobacterium sp. MCSS17_016]WIE81065.1 hypothetical protein DEJ19_021345 [Curtobacterium sp. MCSS17_016]